MLLLAQEDSLFLSDSSLLLIEMDDIIVTGQYQASSYKKAINQIEVIKNEEIQQSGANRLNEVLQTFKGFQISNDPIFGSTLNVRGAGSEDIAILIDGVPVIGRLNGALDLNQISVHNIERIEIAKGALSAQYGNHASAGVINIITKKNSEAPFEIKASQQSESIGINDQFYGIILGHKNLGANFSINKHHNQNVINDSLRVFESVDLGGGFSSKIKKYPWHPKDQLTFTGGLNYKHKTINALNINSSIQYRYFDELVFNAGEIRRPQFEPYANDERYQTKRNDIQAQVGLNGSKEHYWNFIIAQNLYDRVLFADRYVVEGDSIDQSLSAADSTQFKSYYSKVSWSKAFDNFTFQNNIEWNYEEGSGDKIIDSENQSDSTVAKINDIAFSGGVQWKISKNLFSQFMLRKSINSDYATPIIPSLNINYNLRPDINIKAAYGHGFRAPNLKELYLSFIDVNHFILGNQNLKPERSQQVNVEINYAQNDWLSHQLEFYSTSKQDGIILAEYAPAEYNYQNIRNQHIYGTAYTSTITKGIIDWDFTFHFNNREAQIDSIENRYVPAIDLSTQLNIRIDQLRSNIQFSGRYNGQQETYFINEIGLLNTRIQYPFYFADCSIQTNWFNNVFSTKVGVKNITNTLTVESSIASDQIGHNNDVQSRPFHMGRSFFISMQLQLQ